jgi:hypothetical protein
MKRLATGLAAIFGVVLASPLFAQDQETKDTFVPLGRGVPGVLYEPVASGPKSAIAVFVMHAEGDYLQMSACTELAKRGYRVLCANNSASKSGTSSDLSIDQILLDAKLGVAFLRKYPGVRKVVLLGHSGGGALMAAYQNIAENGLTACQGPEKIVKCPDTLAGLPPADGVILLDANFGLAGMVLFSIDPAVEDESTGQIVDPKLDLFNPQNGFNPSGSVYSDAFIHAFLSGVGRRENSLIKTALERLDAISAGKGRFSDDEPFVVPGANYLGFNNKPFAEDTQLWAHTRKAYPLLKKDGAAVTQVIATVRVPEGTKSATPSLETGALKTTVRKFLSSFAVRVNDDFSYDADSIRGVDWLSSYSCPIGSVQGVTAPLLTMGMTGHWEYLAAENIYEAAKSPDKTVAFVEGATHMFTPCTKCEKTAGQFGDTQKTLYDYLDAWLSKTGRF